MYCVSQNRYTSNSIKKVGLFKGVTGQKAPMLLKAFYYIWDDLSRLFSLGSRTRIEVWFHSYNFYQHCIAIITEVFQIKWKVNKYASDEINYFQLS